MLDPQAMLVFAALARAGNVRRAAALLGTPRSTVSRRLQELEAAVGAPLAVRTARRFALTQLGVELAASCRDLEALLDRSEELVRRSAAEPTGTLRIAAAPVIGEEVMPAIVAELLERHPRLSIDVRMSVNYVDLRRGDVDLAVRTGPLEDATDLYATKIGVSTTGYWASAGYLAAHGTPKKPADLARHPCILVGESQGSWRFAGGRVTVSGRVRVDSFRLARDLARRGVGVTRMALMLADGELVPILERHWVETPIYAVHARASPPEPKVSALLALLREAVPRALSRRPSGR